MALFLITSLLAVLLWGSRLSVLPVVGKRRSFHDYGRDTWTH